MEHKRLLNGFGKDEVILDLMAGVGPFVVPVCLPPNVFVWATCQWGARLRSLVSLPDAHCHCCSGLQEGVLRVRQRFKPGIIFSHVRKLYNKQGILAEHCFFFTCKHQLCVVWSLIVSTAAVRLMLVLGAHNGLYIAAQPRSVSDLQPRRARGRPASGGLLLGRYCRAPDHLRKGPRTY